MPLPGQKMYVVTKPDLIQKVQKQHKVLAFPPVEAKFASTVCGVSPETQALLLQNVNGDEGDFGLSMESHAAMRAALKPGQQLDEMNRAMIHEIAVSLDALNPGNAKTRQIDLYGWLRNIITAATTKSVYGPLNPYNDKAIADAFWQVLDTLLMRRNALQLTSGAAQGVREWSHVDPCGHLPLLYSQQTNCCPEQGGSSLRGLL